MSGNNGVTGLVRLTAVGPEVPAALLVDVLGSAFFGTDGAARGIGLVVLAAVGREYGLAPGLGILLSTRDEGNLRPDDAFETG